MNLYQIDKHIQQVLDDGFSFDEETGELLFDMSSLEELQDMYSHKVDNIASYIKNLENLNDAIKNEKKALDERMKQNERKAERLKNYLTMSLNEHGYSNFETPRNRINFRKSESTKIVNELAIPDKFKKAEVKVSINKAEIKKALKNGVEVPGAVLEEKKNMILK